MKTTSLSRATAGPRAWLWACLAGLWLAVSAHAAPGATEAMRAFAALESWVRAWEVPTGESAEPPASTGDTPVPPGKTGETPAPLADPEGTTAACVTLRLAGRVVGRATAVSDRSDAVRLAARGALAQASQRMPVERDALRRERLLALAQSVEIDLQLAGVFVPVVARSLGEAALSVNPGREGVAVRVGERTEAVFPGVMLSTNMTPGDGFVAALGGHGLAPTAFDPDDSGPGRPVLLRFETLHIAQPAAGRPPVFLTRGGRVVGVRDISPAALAQLGDRVARNLISRAAIAEDQARMRGAYHPWNDTFDPEYAEPVEQALAAYALARWANSGRGDEGVRVAAASLAERIVAVVSRDGGGFPGDVAAASMRTVAAIAAENRERAGIKPGAGGPAGTGAPRAPAQEPPLPAPIRAIRAMALAEAAAVQGHDELRRAASEEVRAVFAGATPASMPGLMPWLGYAELALLGSEDRVPSAVALREFRALVERGQVTLADAAPSGDEDFVGGVVFGVGDAALPTAHTLRPFVFLARMLGDDRLTESENRTAHLARLLDALRYTRQLVADEAVCHMFPNRERAMWGVRASLWDQRQPVEAAAMALLLIVESLDAVDAMLGE